LKSTQNASKTGVGYMLTFSKMLPLKNAYF